MQRCSEAMFSNLHSIVSAGLGVTEQASFWFPVQASTNAGRVDGVYNFILWVVAFFFVLIVSLMAVFLARYRRRQGVAAEKTVVHHTGLELTWTIIPTILAVFIFYLGVSAYVDMRIAPQNAYEIQVTAQKWNWSFTYPDGTVSPDLHVPVDQQVRLIMRSEDVLHSFYVPAFRVKMDVVPGRYTTAWFEANQAGNFQIFCTEYCGTKHSGMLAQVVVHEAGGFEKWLEDAGNLSNKPPVELGQELYTSRGCQQCHSVDGARGIGPTFKGIFGTQEVMVGGAKVTVDENYIRESINEPQAKVVNTYAPVMPTFKGKLKDVEINGLIEYIKSLK